MGVGVGGGGVGRGIGCERMDAGRGCRAGGGLGHGGAGGIGSGIGKRMAGPACSYKASILLFFYF